MKSSVVTWCKKSKRSFTFRYITLHGYFSIMELPAATGAITAEPASLETNVKIVRIQGSVWDSKNTCHGNSTR
jgi:hypothetical protein